MYHRLLTLFSSMHNMVIVRVVWLWMFEWTGVHCAKSLFSTDRKYLQSISLHLQTRKISAYERKGRDERHGSPHEFEVVMYNRYCNNLRKIYRGEETSWTGISRSCRLWPRIKQMILSFGLFACLPCLIRVIRYRHWGSNLTKSFLTRSESHFKRGATQSSEYFSTTWPSWGVLYESLILNWHRRWIGLMDILGTVNASDAMVRKSGEATSTRFNAWWIFTLSSVSIILCNGVK